MATNNTLQKKIIEKLTHTHQNPAPVFLQLTKQAETPQEAEQVRKIAQALKIKI